MKKENLLKVEALILMRELWIEQPNCYWSLEDISKKLNCSVKELCDNDNDTGVLYELDYEGDEYWIGIENQVLAKVNKD